MGQNTCCHRTSRHKNRVFEQNAPHRSASHRNSVASRLVLRDGVVAPVLRNMSLLCELKHLFGLGRKNVRRACARTEDDLESGTRRDDECRSLIVESCKRYYQFKLEEMQVLP